jgi:hypothetical protein
MKLSDSLLDLAQRVMRVEDSAAAVQARNQAALQTRREELEAAIDRKVTEIETATAQAAGVAHSRWSDIKKSVENQVSEMRADFDKWQVEVKEKNAELAAEDAEEDAVAAVSIAAYCLDAAEWAVVRAELARGEVEQLAAKG